MGRLRRLGAPPQRELEAKKIDLREKQGAVGGRRWARSSVVINTEQSVQETRDQAERSEQVKRTKPGVSLLSFCTKRIFIHKI